MTFGDYALWVLVTFVALPCCFVLGPGPPGGG
jgi:hypothetical protein